MTRYRDAYLHAKTVNGIGATVKVIAFILGGLIALVGFISCAESANANSFGSGLGQLSGAITFLMGAGVGLLGFVFGVMVQSAGQHLKAQLDSAVNSSPFLTDAERAVVMSLI
jgi:hypothetical protein